MPMMRSGTRRLRCACGLDRHGQQCQYGRHEDGLEDVFHGKSPELQTVLLNY